MSIVGPNGEKIDPSNVQYVGSADVQTYKIGEIQIQTNETPELVLAKALKQVQGLLQQQGQFAASQSANPFQFEPAALAVFMMLSNEVKDLKNQIEQIKKGKEDDTQADDSSGL